MKKQREHKYEIWDRQMKRMSKAYTLGSPVILWQDGSPQTQASNIFLQGQVGRDRYEFRQSSGCKDKFGMTMYEWDIVKAHGLIGLVVWNEDLASFELKVTLEDGPEDERDGMMSIYSKRDDNGNFTEREKIGNLYQNPELLNENVPVPVGDVRSRVKRPRLN